MSGHGGRGGDWKPSTRRYAYQSSTRRLGQTTYSREHKVIPCSTLCEDWMMYAYEAYLLLGLKARVKGADDGAEVPGSANRCKSSNAGSDDQDLAWWDLIREMRG